MPQPSPPPVHPPPQRRGNPLGNPSLNLSPRCGARTRAGCPCRAPALRGKTRCRRHGGASTGPRTADGLARLTAARTVHGQFSGTQRAWDRFTLSSLRRLAMLAQVMRWLDYLPVELAVRVPAARELRAPDWPRAGLTPAQDAMALGAERAALAPWRCAVADAKQAWRDKGRPRVPVLDGGGPGVRALVAHGNVGKPHGPVSRVPGVATMVLPGGGAAPRSAQAGATGARGNVGRPLVPVSLVPGMAMTVTRGGGAAPPSARAGGAGAHGIAGKPHVPVCTASRVAMAVTRGEGAAPPFARTAGAGAEEIQGRPHVPVSSGGALPPADAKAPPAGMNRAERKRWKWEQRKARKHAARDGRVG